MQTTTVLYKSISQYIPRETLVTEKNTVPLRLKGLAASPGIVVGQCTIIRNLEDLHTLLEGTILVCEVPSPKLAPYMTFLRGLVAKRGSPNCIGSRYARENNIPAVVGIGDIIDAIHAGDVIRIDGLQGKVEVIDYWEIQP